MPGAPSSFLLLVAMPFAPSGPSSVLAPSSLKNVKASLLRQQIQMMTLIPSRTECFFLWFVDQ